MEKPACSPTSDSLDVKDIVWSLAITTAVAFAYALAQGFSGLSLPAAYASNAEKGDVVFHLALVKAATEGDFFPLSWKTIRGLGAPYHGNWNDWPIVEEIPTIVIAVFSSYFGLFRGFSIAVFAAQALAGVMFYVVARYAQCNRMWSFIGGLSYALAPYVFSQNPHHPFAAHIWHIPLFLLVWKWVATEPGIAPRSARLFWAMAIAFVTGLQHVYYTNILCQLTILGSVVLAYQKRTWEPLKPALAVVGASAAAFALMNLDTWTYRGVNGPNPGALVREYKWLEIYGLKLVDLVVPPASHHSETFSKFAQAHRAAAPLQDEGSYLGLIGIAALGLLVCTTISDVVNRRADAIPMAAWQVLWVVLCFSTGGLNAILGAFGFTLFRTGCRYSVVVLAISLLYAAQRLTAWQEEAEAGSDGVGKSLVFKAAAALLCALIFWDQVPRAPTAAQTAEIARQVDADREFVATMEKTLPANAMVFQLPVMDFPEAPIPGVPPYDHFRPYIFSKHLRFSFGSHKGREREQWQQQLQNVLVAGAAPDQEAKKIRFNADNVRRAVDELKRLGFKAIYINRNGFPDRGKGLEEALLELGYDKPPIRNATGDLMCVVLQ